MPEWVKVLAGCLALIIGASATPLIICSLNPPSPSSGERQQQHHNTAPQKHTDGDDTKSNSDNAPIGIEHVYTKNNDQVATKREPEGDWYANPDWWVATFTGLLFGATAGLWAATWSLYRTTRKAVIEGQQAIAAAKRSADAASLHANAAIGSQRPFVYLSEFDLRPWRGGDRDYKIHMQIKNYGRTPALRMRISLGRVFGNLPAIPPYQDEGNSEFVLGPDAVYTHEPIWGFRIEEGARLPFVFGRVIYWDFMGGMVEYGFCAAYDRGVTIPNGPILQPPGIFNPANADLTAYRYDRYTPGSITEQKQAT